LNERQLGTALAALRMWQRETDWELRCQDDTASSVGQFEPLNDDEIDKLCEMLNAGQGQPRIVLEIWNDIIDTAYSNVPCELLVVHRDELADSVLPNGERGYTTLLEVSGENSSEVEEAFRRHA
jgi:hypothetical protein